LDQIVKNQEDPTEILKNLIDQSATFRLIWSEYTDTNRLTGLNLAKVKLLHE